MQKRLLSIQDILQQESIVETETQEKLGGFYIKAHQGIDLLIKLLYYIPIEPNDESANHNYASYLHSWFYMASYTFRACILLFSKGYYFEALILNRNLIETLGKMRYFSNHKEDLQKLENVESIKTGKPRMNFKTIFDEVFPEFYPEYRMSSHFAHSGIGARLMKIKYNSPTNIESDTGVVYNEWRATHIIHNFEVYFLGYVRFYKKIYPDAINNLPLNIKNNFAEIEDWFENSIRAHIKLKGGENDWHKAVKQIWDI
ncbi:MAG: hypothetical protein WC420_00020 [Candidatus Paceibacterota bacterium]|jgi:hypothetical protein